MTNCEDYSNVHIQDACEDMQGMDDEQKLQRLHDLLVDLDAEELTISSNIDSDFYKLCSELNELSKFTLNHIGFKNVLDEPDLFRKSYCLFYMINDFKVDGDIGDDLFSKYADYGIIRNEYIETLKQDIPKVTLYPNPVSDRLTISFQYEYGFHSFGTGIEAISIGSGQSLLPFDPLIYLPKKIDQNFNENNLSQNIIYGSIYDFNGNKVDNFHLPIDKDGNIQVSVDVSSLKNGIYIVKIEETDFSYGEDLTGELRGVGINGGHEFNSTVVVQH